MAHTLFSHDQETRSNLQETRDSHKIRQDHTFYQASAPGSLMLFGEHAVLAGKRALCTAINQHIKVTLIPRTDTLIRLKSTLGEHEVKLEEIPVFSEQKVGTAPFHFVLTTISLYRDSLKTGFDLMIDSEFSSLLGWGSSAAVVVATLRVLARYANPIDIINSETLDSYQANDTYHTKINLFKQALSIILAVQGKGSGADVAACVFGGVVLYRKDPLLIKVHIELPPLIASYVGYKTPTVEVIQKVEEKFKESPYLLECLFDAMETCTETAWLAIQEKDWKRLGHCMNVSHGLLNSLGVSDLALEKAAVSLREKEGIFGAKISGAGLGDCVIGVGLGVGEIKQLEADHIFAIETSLLGVHDVVGACDG